MPVRRLVVAVVGVLGLVLGPASPAVPATFSFATQCSVEDFNGDPRLGPRELPTWGSVGFELLSYDRFGGLTPAQFLATYWDPAANGGAGGWRYPPANGFLIGPFGQPVHTAMSLFAGQLLDRYGSEFGAFLAPTGSPYSSRAIPPQSLDNTTTPGTCNYVAYRVARSFSVDGGPIAPAFGQPGLGLQYMLVGALVPGAPERLNVRWLIDNGYLLRCTAGAFVPFTC
jgi:hypothetical protein